MLNGEAALLRFDAPVTSNLDEAGAREWLETNGLGGFASSTISGMNTRRYHAVLTAALHPPVQRQVLVAKLEETLVVGDARYDLSTNQYGDVIHPRGFEHVVEFKLDPWPTWTFQCGSARLCKSLFMVHGSNTTAVRYELEDGRDQAVQLEVRPLIAGRDYHSVVHENGSVDHNYAERGDSLEYRPYDGVATIHVGHSAAKIEAQGFWYRHLFYTVERERGLEDTEDLFNPFALTFDMTQDTPATLMLSTEPVPVTDYDRLCRGERERRSRSRHACGTQDPVARQLISAADQFIVRRGQGHSVIAGYPWFTDWGRDTMISLPGLTLFGDRTQAGAEILRTFAGAVSEGMIPNRFPDDENASPEYNTVDASLWFVDAVRAYAERTHDMAFVREMYATLTTILECHIRGTRYGIRMLEDGLLHAGEPGIQLTWMDARVGDRVITPRYGKPVEIQALWFNSLGIMADFSRQLGKTSAARRFEALCATASRSFNEQFWNAEAECLYDVVSDEPDASIRPNQIFAVSLPNTMLDAARGKAVVQTIERELLTPYGLRTLSPGDSSYRGTYAGNSAERDAVYHQGTVWPWLLGPFVTAYLNVNGREEPMLERARTLLRPLEEYLLNRGVGQLPEIFDGDAQCGSPGKGCFAQAWSVAELLRCRMQNGLGAPPLSGGD